MNEMKRIVKLVEDFDNKIDYDNQPYLVEQMANILCNLEFDEKLKNKAYKDGQIVGMCETICVLGGVYLIINFVKRKKKKKK